MNTATPHRRLWRVFLSYLSGPWQSTALVVLIVCLLCWNATQLWRLRPGGKAPPQSPNAVICTNCGWRGWRETLHLPQRCPKCHELAVHFAGLCPRCGTWTVWDVRKEKLVFAQPRLFIDLGPAAFFPVCSRCGCQTKPRGEPSLSLPSDFQKKLKDHQSAPRARGDKR